MDTAGNSGAGVVGSTSTSQTGTLIASGSDPNENFYADCDYTGGASDLTESTFVMGKTSMAMDNKAWQPLTTPITLHYGPDTVVTKGTVHYESDTYELYTSSLDEFQSMMNASQNSLSVAIFLDNTNSQELRVREIRIENMDVNGQFGRYTISQRRPEKQGRCCDVCDVYAKSSLSF